VTTWILLRAAGIGAYVALWLSVTWGLVATTGVVTRRMSKPSSNHFHAFLAASGLALLAVHLVLLLVHEYMPFHTLDLLVPLRSTYRPVAIAFGIVAMYALIAIAVSSWSRKRLSNRAWRAIHLSAVPAFALTLLHGVFAGTDTARPGMFWLYAVSGVLVLFLVLVRGLTAGYRPPRPAPPARAPREGTREPASAA
jgi:DMSO/TMAO reductase YedYZ heme-binding membrane subunit